MPFNLIGAHNLKSFSQMYCLLSGPELHLKRQIVGLASHVLGP